jgi:hypothetical protein
MRWLIVLCYVSRRSLKNLDLSGNVRALWVCLRWRNVNAFAEFAA